MSIKEIDSNLNKFLDTDTKFRLYIGNLKPNCPEETIRSLFENRGIVVGSIVTKRSYAFVDCIDQANVDIAIDKLNGHQFSWSDNMEVEPASGRRRRSNKIQIRNIPNIGIEEIQELVSSYGLVQKCELVGAEDLVYVTFDNPDTAQMAVQGLNGIDFQGSTIKVDFATNRSARKLRMNNIGMQGQSAPGSRPVDFPLRMVVGSEFIGAIIGRAGQTIQNITSQSRARVDIHRSEMAMTPETVITIKGTPESCSNACFEVMKIVQSEAQSLLKGGKGPQEQLGNDRDHSMRILCPNTLCGRIIGKSGSVIKGFMEQSETHIIVSSVQDSTYYTDRVVTIMGPLENCKKAEALISEKMRKCAEMDQQNSHNMGLYGGMPPRGPMGPGPNFYQGGRGFQPVPYNLQSPSGMYQNGPGLYGMPPPMPPQQLEVIYLYIPESTVGAVIGTKGSNIKNIMRLSNARIKIFDQNQGSDDQKDHSSPRNDQRKVIITGTSEAQWKAHFYIVEKIKSETMAPKLEDIHLRVEILVPKGAIGRIIGKGGQHVKEMQRVTGATVKTPDTQSVPDNEDVPVSILGDFYASQSAQHRIRALLSQSIKGPSGERARSGGRQPMNGN